METKMIQLLKPGLDSEMRGENCCKKRSKMAQSQTKKWDKRRLIGTDQVVKQPGFSRNRIT